MSHNPKKKERTRIWQSHTTRKERKRRRVVPQTKIYFFINSNLSIGVPQKKNKEKRKRKKKSKNPDLNLIDFGPNPNGVIK